jgi:hypothetical protein
MAITITRSFTETTIIIHGRTRFLIDRFYNVIAAPYLDDGVAQIRVTSDIVYVTGSGGSAEPEPSEFIYHCHLPGTNTVEDVTNVTGNNKRIANMDVLFKKVGFFDDLEDRFSEEIFLLSDK